VNTCTFCNIQRKQAKQRIIYADEVVTAFLAKDAIAPGQTLVIPNRHVQTISDLEEKEVSAVFSLARSVSNLLLSRLQAGGVNIVCNSGACAGQTVDHFHVHIIPRHKGDVGNHRLWLNQQLYDRLYAPTLNEYNRVKTILKADLQRRMKTLEQERLFLDGVTIEEDVTVGRGVYFGKNIHIYPHTMIGDGCIVEDNVVIGHPTPEEVKEFVGSTIVRKNLSQFSRGSTRIGEHSIIRSGAVIYSMVTVGTCFDCGHNVLIRERTTIGDDVYFLPGTLVHAEVSIGNNVRLYGFVGNRSVVEDNASVLGNLIHVYKKGRRGRIEEAPRISKGAVVGMGAAIIGGITVGENAVVGANAVVTNDLPPNKVFVGIPARETRATIVDVRSPRKEIDRKPHSPA
jgi:diadenosine tetraphosphate (Ap4A) HIT family hydrolase/carbonic anhydrase/acetyltransferase-like protein (isoleucine patch superfamily)